MADPISGLQNLYGDITTKPGETLGNLWGSFSSTAPGLGIPGGGVPGAMTSMTKYSPRVMQLLDQINKYRLSPAMFQQPNRSQIVAGPAAHELANEAPDLFKWLHARPETVWTRVNPMLKSQGKYGETTNIAEMRRLLEEAPQYSTALEKLSQTGVPKEAAILTEWMPQGKRAVSTIPHEALHAIYGLKNQTGFPEAQYLNKLYTMGWPGVSRSAGELVAKSLPRREIGEEVIQKMAENYLRHRGPR